MSIISLLGVAAVKQTIELFVVSFVIGNLPSLDVCCYFSELVTFSNFNSRQKLHKSVYFSITISLGFVLPICLHSLSITLNRYFIYE